VPRQILHLRRDQLRGRRPGGETRRDPRPLRRRGDRRTGRRLGRLPRLALQRAALEHGAAAAAEPRVAGLARGHGTPPRRGPGADSRVTPTPEEALEQAALAGVHRLPVPTPFAVGKVNAYLIEDDPLTLIDGGPNYGRGLDVLSESIAAHGHT